MNCELLFLLVIHRLLSSEHSVALPERQNKSAMLGAAWNIGLDDDLWFVNINLCYTSAISNIRLPGKMLDKSRCISIIAFTYFIIELNLHFRVYLISRNFVLHIFS